MSPTTRTLRQAIVKVQKIGERYGLVIVVVGGAFVRNIAKKVTIQKIDTKSKTIYISGALNPGLNREEDPTTTVDIDAIVFSSPKEDTYSPSTKIRFTQLMKELTLLQQSEKGFPAISLEPVLYHPLWPKPNLLTQFVSSIESYPSGQFLFRLGSVSKTVSAKSLAVWTYVFTETEERIASLMPPAIQMRYAIRGFTIKPKDKEKIWGETSAFAQFVNEFNKKTEGKYAAYLEEWEAFAKTLQSSPHLSIRIKRALWNTYWKTIGTYLAHGKGLIGKFLLPFGNTFFAGK